MNAQEHTTLQTIKKHLMHSQHALVIEQCTTLLNNTTLSAEAKKEVLYLLSVAHRLMGQTANAINALTTLIGLYPDYARAFQELGYCYLKQDAKLSAENFYQATRYNPALITAWQQLERVYQSSNQDNALHLCQQQIGFLKSLPRPILGATDLMYEGQLHKAEQICRQFLDANKHHPEAMILLAEIGIRLKIYSDAEFLLESCVMFYPENDRAAALYQSLLAKLGKFSKAADVARLRLERIPNNFTAKVGLAHALVGTSELDEAIAIYNTLLEENDDRAPIWVALGHALKAKGATKNAVKAYEKATVLAPEFGDPYWSLANTKTYQFSDELLSEMKRQVTLSTTKLEDTIHLCFAIGKAYEDRAEYKTSFTFYEKGNALKNSVLQFDLTKTEAAINAQKRGFTATSFNDAGGCRKADPIFIVGLPRAGSTLLEQILASHSLVDGTMELHDIMGIVSSLTNQKVPYPFNVSSLSETELTQLGQQYLSQTQVYRQGAPFFIDKMPNNFIHIGLIKKILPNAKIIDARRHPMDCCFSGFKQLFGEGQEFSYNLHDIARYYKAYASLMDHWHDVLPGQILTVQHEDVLDDLEGQVRRILTFCNLDFEAACLRFYDTKRIIKTPSSEQVRQPLYRSGMGQWKPFENYLSALKSELGDLT